MESPCRLLLIDDDEEDFLIVRDLLLGHGTGFQVDWASSYEAGLASICQEEHDVYLLDYRLGRRNGLDLLREAVDSGCQAPIIMLTGEGDEAADRAAIKGGAADYLVKGDLSAALLARVIRHALERTQILQRLRQRDQELQRFEALVESSDDAIFTKTLDGIVTSWNRGAERLYGYTAAEMIGRPLSVIIPPDSPRELDGILARLNRGERIEQYETVRVKKDGSRVTVSKTISPIKDPETGRVVGVSSIARDITEKKRAEEALRESETRFRKLIEASFDGVVISVEGVIRDVNLGYARIFGYSSVEDMIGLPISELVAEESLEMVQQRVRDGFEGTYQLIGKRRDGSKIRIEVTGRMHQTGGVWVRLSAVRDVTEKHLLEEQVRQSQKMEAVGRLAGGIAHDFNNLLTVITTFAELLTQDLAPGGREELDEITKAAAAASGLTRQLLAFSRQQVIQPKLVTIEAIVTSAEKMLRRVIGEDIELAAVLSPEPATVKIDPGQLEQVILNLAVNARDAMPQGGKLTLETTTVELDQVYARSHMPVAPGRYAMLSVSDTGAGMDEKTRDRIFEPFFTTKELGKGTGLGLSTVYGIVKQSGGFIWVYSELGQGTTFKIYLPRIDQPPTPFKRESTANTSLRGDETVLLAEDAAAVRAAATRILSRHGYTVLEAPSGKTAINLAARRQGPIHLLLTDVVMPQMSGREVAEQVVASRPGVKVLYMSGYTDDAVVRHGVLQPGIAFLQKPFTPEALVRKVREVLDAPPPAQSP